MNQVQLIIEHDLSNMRSKMKICDANREIKAKPHLNPSTRRYVLNAFMHILGDFTEAIDFSNLRYNNKFMKLLQLVSFDNIENE